MDPAPFYNPPHVRFRMAKIMDGECSASECSLICNDYWERGYGRVMMVPRVKLAYDRVRVHSVSALVTALTYLHLNTESLRYNTSHEKELDGHKRLCTFRWPS